MFSCSDVTSGVRVVRVVWAGLRAGLREIVNN